VVWATDVTGVVAAGAVTLCTAVVTGAVAA
jgi:hypothetical protein